MNQLEKTLTSLEVAEMVGREHYDVMKDIRRIVGQLGEGTSSVTYFIESEYTNLQNKKFPSFLLTKKGCELYSTRMTGEKGTQFAVAYIERFNEMEQNLLEQAKPSYMINDPIKRAEQWIAEQKEVRLLERENKELKPKATYHDLILQNDSLLSATQIAKDLGMGAPTLNKKLYELGVQYKKGHRWYLYHKFQDKGYAQSKTHPISADKSKDYMYWTQKGKKFIFDLLEIEEGIVPVTKMKELV